MNIFTCALSIVLSCGSPSASALNATHAAAAFTDTYATQRLISLCRVYAGCDPSRVEANPLTRPVQNLGKPAAYILTYWGLVASNLAANKLRTNHRGWARALAPVIQSVEISSSAYGIRQNISTYNRKLAECGNGCRAALGVTVRIR